MLYSQQKNIATTHSSRKSAAMLKKMVKKIVVGLMPLWLYHKLELAKKQYHFNLRHKLSRKVKPLEKPDGKSPQYIVSLTSYGKRAASTAPVAIHSLFFQNPRPDRIVLWLAHETPIPVKLKELQKLGLEIKFCEDIKSFKKLIPALREFPNDFIITADDDIYYPENWFQLLKVAHEADPGKIHCHRAHEIRFNESKTIVPYREWKTCVKSIEHRKRIFPTSGGGILYPPKIFSDEIFDSEKFQKLTPTADDIWFWAMALANDKEFSIVENCVNGACYVGLNNEGLFTINGTGQQNDLQLENIFRNYPKVLEKIR